MKKTLNKYQYPFYAMLHPMVAFDEMRYRKKTSLLMTVPIVAALVLVLVLFQQFEGWQFVMADPNEVDLFQVILLVLGGLALFTISNWGFCVFLEGKATFREIWIMTVDSLLPFTVLSALRLVLSNVLTREEGVFLTLLTIVGALWSLVMLISAFMIFHEYELSRAIGALLLTVVGMVICVALLFLLYSLAQQFFSTILTVFNEMIFRLRE